MADAIRLTYFDINADYAKKEVFFSDKFGFIEEKNISIVNTTCVLDSGQALRPAKHILRWNNDC